MTHDVKCISVNWVLTCLTLVVLIVFLHSLYERRTMRDYVNAKLAGR